MGPFVDERYATKRQPNGTRGAHFLQRAAIHNATCGINAWTRTGQVGFAPGEAATLGGRKVRDEASQRAVSTLNLSELWSNESRAESNFYDWAAALPAS